jgi:hypothetical protein
MVVKNPADGAGPAAFTLLLPGGALTTPVIADGAKATVWAKPPPGKRTKVRADVSRHVVLHEWVNLTHRSP